VVQILQIAVWGFGSDLNSIERDPGTVCEGAGTDIIAQFYCINYRFPMAVEEEFESFKELWMSYK